MIVFIIPLKSAQVSQSWKRVCLLLERTLKSICHQTHSEFRVIVVCHELPQIAFVHPQIEYIQVDFPVPSKKQTGFTQKDYEGKRLDKSKKIWKGLISAGNFNPSHVMFVDADDCISKYIAKFIQQQSTQDTWYINSGYEYQDGSPKIYHRKKGFHQKCGTSHIIQYEMLLDKIPKFEEITWEYLRHQQIKFMVEQQEKQCEPLPFDGAVYMTENQENIWIQKKFFLQRNLNPQELVLFYLRRWYKFLVSKPLTQTLRDEFGIYEI